MSTLCANRITHCGIVGVDPVQQRILVTDFVELTLSVFAVAKLTLR